VKLNPECVRDILFSVEENTGYDIYLDYPKEIDKCPLLKTYKDDEIRYHFFQCAKAGLIEIQRADLADNLAIRDLTPKGHELLANIRSDKVWVKTKHVASSIGSMSLDFLSKIAANVLSELIKQNM